MMSVSVTILSQDVYPNEDRVVVVVYAENKIKKEEFSVDLRLADVQSKLRFWMIIEGEVAKRFNPFPDYSGVKYNVE